MKIASVLSWTLGIGFGLPCAFGIWYFATHGQVWTFLGFPTYGDGPFAKAGIETTVPLLAAFLGVCAAEALAGWLMWAQPRPGAWMGLALLPLELVFWIGFALPYGLLLGLARTVAILASLVSLGRSAA